MKKNKTERDLLGDLRILSRAEARKIKDNKTEMDLLEDLRILSRAMEILQKRVGISFRPKKHCKVLYNERDKVFHEIMALSQDNPMILS